jgi:hypothetical protein
VKGSSYQNNVHGVYDLRRTADAVRHELVPPSPCGAVAAEKLQDLKYTGTRTFIMEVQATSLCRSTMQWRHNWNPGETPAILKLGTRGRRVVSITLRPLYPPGKSPQCPLGPRTGLETMVAKGKIPATAGNRTPVVQSVRRQSWVIPADVLDLLRTGEEKYRTWGLRKTTVCQPGQQGLLPRFELSTN